MFTPMEDVVVMLPKSMQFGGGTADFASGGEEKGLNIFVARNVPVHKQLAFSVSGTGQIPREAQDGETADGQVAASGAPDNRPGGGLGRPEETPDPLHAYRWWIIGGLGAALVVGAIVVMNQKPRTPAVAAAVASSPVVESTVSPAQGSLLQAMKEELFQLETERLQGKISDLDYQQAKAALDLTIKRAIARSKP